MSILSKKDKKTLKALFAKDLKDPVRMVLFTQKESLLLAPSHECRYCKDTRKILEELEDLTDRLQLEVHDFVSEGERAEELDIPRIPALELKGNAQGRVRFFGVPAGYEFSALVEAIIDVSRGTTKLSPATKEKLAQVKVPIHIQVFTTPTCPYCPRAVRLAHMMAVENPYVTADVIEITEFPQLAQKYGIQGVPMTIVNENVEIAGAVPEDQFLEKVLETVSDIE